MIQITVPEFDLTVSYTDITPTPHKSGIYVIYGNSDEVLYVGRTNDLNTRLYAHFCGGDAETGGLSHYFYKASMFYEENIMNLDIYETYVINELRPLFNVRKTFLYKPEKPVRSYKHRVRADDMQRYQDMKCKGINREGKQCGHKVRPGKLYCHMHDKRLV